MSPTLTPKPLLEVSFFADLDTIEGILALVQEWAQQQGVHYDDRLSLRLVLEELLSNITLHNSSPLSEHEGQTKVTLSLNLTTEGNTQNIHVHIRDTGKAFNPLNHVVEPIEQINTTPTGKRGLSFVQLFTRNAQYIRREGNEFFFLLSLDDEKGNKAEKIVRKKQLFSWANLKQSLRFSSKNLWPQYFYTLWKEKLAFRQTVIITLYAIILMWGGMAIFYHSTQRTLQENATKLAMQAMHAQDVISSTFFLRVQKNLDRMVQDLQKAPVESLFAMNAKSLTTFLENTPISARIAAELPILGVVAGYKNTTWFYPIIKGKFAHHVPIEDVSSYVSKKNDTFVWKRLDIGLEQASPHAALIYAVPLSTQHAKDGFIGTVVGMSWIANSLLELTNFTHAQPFYLNHEGKYIIFPPGRQWNSGPQSLQDEANFYQYPSLKTLEKNILNGEKGLVSLESLFGSSRIPWNLHWSDSTTLVYYPTQIPGKFLGLLVSSHELGQEAAPPPLGFIAVAIFGPLCVACITWTVISLTLRPLQSLTSAIEKLSDGDTESPVPTAPFPDELNIMLSTFEQVRITLRTSFRNLVNKTAKQQRLTNEMAVARSTQESMLPRTLPQISGTEVKACLDMAYEVCGDLYTSFVNPQKPTQIYFVIGDVCSKGIAAALIMSRAVSLATSFLLQESVQAKENTNKYSEENTCLNSGKNTEIKTDKTLSKTLEHLNTALLRNDTSGMFVTMLVASLDTKSGIFTWASAGHPPPLLSAPYTAEAKQLPWSEELVLNVKAKQSYTTFTEQLVAGQSILLYTDGATEAISPPNRIQGQLYGEERLKRTFHEACQHKKHAEQILCAVHEDIVSHMQGKPPSDDISLMVIRWQG